MKQDYESWWWRLVKFSFHLLYHEMAFTYDLVSKVVSFGQWHCWQRAALPYLSNTGKGIILELAHGTGNLQLDLQRADYRSIGYDLSSQMGQIARRKMLQHNLNPQLIRGMAQQLPFADASFAAIVSTFPTNFIVSPDTLKEAYRVLQSDACMIVVLNGVMTSSDRLTQFMEWLYQITGQREAIDYKPEDYFGGYGFSVEVVREQCKNSMAELIILRK
jgi:ubiquinone/menaquinone biosynthesis C-methylase UbiE